MVRMLIAAVALGLITSVGAAEEKDVKKTDRPVERRDFDKDNPLDRMFIIKAHQCCNNAENGLVIVENLASSDKVKEFAKKAKKDHDELQDEIGKAVKDKKLAVVATPDREFVNQLNELRKKEKAEFDKAFLTHFVEGHEKMIKMAENQKSNGKDKEATALAEKMLPVLREHLKQAKELQKGLK